MNDTAADEVGHGDVLRTSVVPDHDVTFLPAMAVREVGPGEVLQQHCEDRLGLDGRKVDDAPHERLVDEEARPATHRVMTDHGVFGRNARRNFVTGAPGREQGAHAVR